ncbi:MAG: UvrD-helicase domain-containing protein, partial [Bacillota bacterium]|nr:UvrD-helicase domain-containing protein [Bacillota bacterium]
MTAEPALSLEERVVENLSDEQREAVLSHSRYIRIVAAAGAGKTETITRRLVYLLATDAVPESLVAFTFTEKAAAQMKDRIYRRVEQILGPGATASLGLMYVGTIHAYCLRLLQDHFRLGNVDVLDQNREYAFISRHARELGIAGQGRVEKSARLLRTAAVWCDELLSLDAVCKEEPELGERLERYFALLKRHRLITFGQLVRQAYEALSQDPAPVLAVSNLIVDEFQDINRAQEELIHLVAARSSCCVVGDPRQCIYQWRGSDPGCFDRFTQRLPKVQD